MEKLHLPIIIEMDADGYYIVSYTLFNKFVGFRELEVFQNV